MPNPIRPGSPRVPGTPTGPQTYRVQSGDSLGAIAQRFGTSVDAILAANGLTDPDRIFPGQNLVIPNGNATGGLAVAAGRSFTFEELWPSIQAAATRHGADAQVMAAIVRQESSFINHRVHRDGTGHGLIGLDDGGRLPEFERWAGMRVGRGRAAVVIPPERQLEFLARTLAASTQRYGDPMAAAREWHRGHGGMNDRLGQRYQDLIEGHIQTLFS
jgi:LysM repeat protein